MTDRRVVLHPDPEAILAPIRAVGMGALIGIDGDLGTTPCGSPGCSPSTGHPARPVVAQIDRSDCG